MTINDKRDVKACDVIRLIPYIYMVSPETGKEVKIRLFDGLRQPDAEDFTAKLMEKLADTPHEVLTYLRRTALLEMANDWRYMTTAEIDDFLRRDVDEENGVEIPDIDEVPPNNENEDF